MYVIYSKSKASCKILQDHNKLGRKYPQTLVAARVGLLSPIARRGFLFGQE